MSCDCNVRVEKDVALIHLHMNSLSIYNFSRVFGDFFFSFNIHYGLSCIFLCTRIVHVCTFNEFELLIQKYNMRMD